MNINFKVFLALLAYTGITCGMQHKDFTFGPSPEVFDISGQQQKESEKNQQRLLVMHQNFEQDKKDEHEIDQAKYQGAQCAVCRENYEEKTNTFWLTSHCGIMTDIDCLITHLKASPSCMICHKSFTFPEKSKRYITPKDQLYLMETDLLPIDEESKSIIAWQHAKNNLNNIIKDLLPEKKDVIPIVTSIGLIGWYELIFQAWFNSPGFNDFKKYYGAVIGIASAIIFFETMMSRPDNTSRVSSFRFNLCISLCPLIYSKVRFNGIQGLKELCQGLVRVLYSKFKAENYPQA